MADVSRRRARRRSASRRRRVAAAAAVVAVGTGTGVALAATSSDSSPLRLATVGLGSVDQTVEASGTITSSVQLTPSFATSGTVESVSVKVGDTVRKGQVLARLDTSSLQTTVDSANQTLANARQRLEADETGQTSAASSVANTTSSSQYQTSSYSEEELGTPTAVSAVAMQTVPIQPVSIQTSSSETSFGRTSSSQTSFSRTSSSPRPATGSGHSVLVQQVEDAQRALIAARQHLDAAQAAIDTAEQVVNSDVVENTKLRDAQTAACASSATPSATSSETSTSTDPTSSTTSAATSPTPSPTSSNVSTDCAAAMAAYESSADQLSADVAIVNGKLATQGAALKELDAAITKLDDLIRQVVAAMNTSTGSATGPGGSTPPSTGQSGSGRTGSSRGTGGTGTGGSTGTGGRTSGSPRGSTGPQGNTGQQGSTGTTPNSSRGSSQTSSQPASAAQLAADQQAIDAAQAQLSVAQRNLAAATLTSPVAGTVADVELVAGESAGSHTITIIGTDLRGVNATVPLAQVDEVKVGQQVTVAADGVSTALHGTVTSVGLMSSASGTSASYPVVITLSTPTPNLYDGTGADIVIDTGTARNVVVVPNSAIHSGLGGRRTVSVLQGGKTTTVLVTLGLAGSDATEVKSGLRVGQQVVLADPSQALPSSTNGANSGFRFPGFGGVVRNAGR